MHRTPSREDEQPEHARHPHQTYKHRPDTARRRQMDYYSDEHPEIPRVRRASLYLDSDQTAPVPRRSRQFEAPTSEIETPPETPSLPPYPRSTSKIMVAKRRRPIVYEPPTISHPSHSRSQRNKAYHQPQFTLTDFLARMPIGRYRTPLLVGCIFLACLILLSVASNILRGNPASQQGIVTTSSANNGVISKTASNGQQTSNPHELVIVPPNTDHSAPPVFATAAYLLDADTGQTLYAHNPFMHLPMLSTTKLMTATLAAEQGKPDQNVTITPAIANDISQLSADSALMGLKKGETYTMRELLYGLLLVSGNDAAIAIGDAIGGNLNNFVAQMNQRASQLGLNDTHYLNPHGLLMNGHYSSAHDLALLGAHAFSLPLLHQISGTREDILAQTASHATHDLVNGNQFMWWYPGVDSGKTGWDAAANFIQVVSCVRNGHHLIGVTMHTNDWWTDMRDLMNWGFNTYTWISPRDVDAVHAIPFDTDWNYFAKDTKEITIPIGTQARYYIYTGYSIGGLIMAYFDKNSGLKKFGFPTSSPNAGDDTTISQQFEHGSIKCDTVAKACQIV